MTERKPKGCDEVFARRPQDPMLVRPGEGEATNGIPVVREIVPRRRAQHQVQFFTGEQSVGHCRHDPRPAPMGSRRLARVVRQQVQRHAQVGLGVCPPRRPGVTGLR